MPDPDPDRVLGVDPVADPITHRYSTRVYRTIIATTFTSGFFLGLAVAWQFPLGHQ